MKKAMLVIIPILLVFGIGIIIFLDTTKYDRITVGDFQLSEYRWAIEDFPYNRNVGSVDNPRTAIERAKELWVERFSRPGEKPYNHISSRKVEVSFDAENECWLVNGVLPFFFDGGAPNAIIQRNGEVLAVWHDQ